jgi:hypothetical protein
LEFVKGQAFHPADFRIRSDGVCRLNPEKWPGAWWGSPLAVELWTSLFSAQFSVRNVTCRCSLTLFSPDHFI